MKQPKAIYTLFLTEMWERFSYYGLTALLILYMSQSFGVPDQQVYAIYGAYGALVYTTPILGGLVADRVLGVFYTVVVGALLIAAGHFVMAIPGTGHRFFYMGLAFIILGTGFFLPNIATVVGGLYGPDDPRRDGGFTLAYMGRNLGTILAPLVASWVALRYGYLTAFSLAGFGMLFGLVIFLRGRHAYAPELWVPAKKMDLGQRGKAARKLLLAAVVVAALVLIDYAMQHVALTGVILYSMGAVTLAALLFVTLRSPREERNAMLLVLLLTGFFIVFMALLQQSGGMLNLFTLRHVDRQWMQWTIPTGWYQSVEPLFILSLGGLYAKFWRYLASKRVTFSYPLKFAIGLFVMGIAFFVLALGMHFLTPKNLMPMSWINVSYFFQAASELFIGPIGLGMISLLVPGRYMGLFMGAWVLAMAFANFVAAKIGALTSPTQAVVSQLSTQAALTTYHVAFVDLMWLAFGSAVLLFLLIPLLRKVYRQRQDSTSATAVTV